MNQNQFKELYKFYQSTLLSTFEEEISEMGWKITKRIHRSNYSRDIANLELRINGNGIEKEGSAFFGNAWKEVLFIDRDEVPLRVDLRILDRNFGIAKLTSIAVERAEIMDAAFKNDQERLHALGRIVDRLRAIEPLKRNPEKEKVTFHYENGAEQSDIGTFVPRRKDE